MSTENVLLTKPVIYEANGQEVKLTGNIVRNYLVRGKKNEIKEQELVMFMNLCKYQNLNPFLNEAYIVKFGNDAQIIVGKEAFMKRAYRSKDFIRLDAGIIVQRKDEIVYEDGSFMLPSDSLVGGWATLHREDQEPFKMTVSFKEFDTGKSTWIEKPALMIRKVAQVNCLREAYPEELGAMYTEDEMPSQEIEVLDGKEDLANTETLDFEEVEDDTDTNVDTTYEEIAEDVVIEPMTPQTDFEGQVSFDNFDGLPMEL